MTDDHVVHGRIDRRRHHASNQRPATPVLDVCRQQFGGEIDQLSLGAFEVDVDLVGPRCRVHDEEMQVVEFVLSDQKVDDLYGLPLSQTKNVVCIST